VSGALIAGAVVGPICAVALILGLAFLFFRRRRNHTALNAQQQQQQQNQPDMQNQGPPPPQSAYANGFAGYSENKDGNRVSVMPVSPAMSSPPGYQPQGPPSSGMLGAQQGMNGAPPAQSPQFNGNASPQPGHGAVELGTNPQVHNMPSELPVWSR
jgi:hypothetical protein